MTSRVPLASFGLLLLCCSDDWQPAVLGEVELVGSGIFDPVNDTSLRLSTTGSMNDSCHRHDLTIHNTAEDNDSSFHIALPGWPGPFYPGREWGLGSVLTVGSVESPQGATISSGAIWVEELRYDQGSFVWMDLTLGFDLTATAGGARPDWYEPVETEDRLEGTVTIRQLGTDVHQGCSWPDLVAAPGLVTYPDAFSSVTVTGASLDPTGYAELPVLHWGTEATVVSTHTMIETWVGLDPTSAVEVWVEPDTATTANHLCGVAIGDPQDHAGFCEAWSEEPFSFEPLEGFLDGLDEHTLDLVFTDRYGVQPVLSLGLRPETWPVVSLPDATEGGSWDTIQGRDPVRITWTGEADPEATVTVSLTPAESERPAVMLEAPDTGELLLDPSEIAGLSGLTIIEVERRVILEQSGDLPLLPSSTQLLSASDGIAVEIADGSLAQLPELGEAVEGWAVPEILEDPYADQGAKAACPVLLRDDAGQLHAMWQLRNATPVDVRTRSLDASGTEWSALRTGGRVDRFDGAYGGAVGPDGQLLYWAWSYDGHASSPLGVWFDDDRVRIMADLALGSVELGRTRDIGAGFTADGIPVLMPALDDGSAALARGLEPVTTLLEGELAVSDTRLYQLSDGRHALAYDAASGPHGFYLFDPDDPQGGYRVEADTEDEPWDPRWGALLPDDGLVVPCCDVGLASTSSPLTGDLRGELERYTDDETIRSLWAGVQPVSGVGGDVWFMVELDRDPFSSWLLYHRDAAGVWGEPLPVGYAWGPASLAVDDSGRLHVLYIPPWSEYSLEEGEQVLHTWADPEDL